MRRFLVELANSGMQFLDRFFLSPVSSAKQLHGFIQQPPAPIMILDDLGIELFDEFG
jgi:hypothetical protein